MSDRSRVPRPLNEFDRYINVTDNYLQATDQATSLVNWQRLELKAQEASWWHARRLHWRDTLNPLRVSKDTKTVAVSKKVADFVADFKANSGRILDKIAAADASDHREELTFRLVLKKNRKKPGYHQTQIKDGVMVGVDLLSGGQLRISGRTAHDRNRASLANMANSMQLAYSIGAPPKEPMEDNTIKVISTRAVTILDLGVGNIGKWLYLYVRWYHTKHPRLAGGWSTMMRVMIG